jgi:hypothetical protein
MDFFPSKLIAASQRNSKSNSPQKSEKLKKLSSHEEQKKSFTFRAQYLSFSKPVVDVVLTILQFLANLRRKKLAFSQCFCQNSCSSSKKRTIFFAR